MLQFHLYNTALRQYPKVKYEWLNNSGSLYTTTIHVLVSAVQKIARSTKLQEGLKLYRGLGTTLDFPDSFFKSDRLGCRGFVEWGFVSTTADKDVAFQYSGLEDGRQLPMVLEITVGSVARGACIREVSQYPHEEEHLWVPCSFLESAGNRVLEVTPEGVVALIPVRINVNLKARTAEEIRGQKR